ncbi:MAG: sugar phosphate nucleotidyltransferase [Candidatus Margulisiibacteriota bacterium]
MDDLRAIILAAGKGVRMRSDLPKVFHPVLGRPLLVYVIETVKQLGIHEIYVVVGHKKEVITGHFRDAGVEFVEQAEQLGTGHAVQQVEPYFKDFKGEVLVLAGDVPLLKCSTLKGLIDFHRQQRAAATVLTADLPDAGAYGRIIRDRQGRILRIVEKKDASPEELMISEINTGTYCFDSQALFKSLAEVKAENAQKEYYLTDTIEILREKGLPVFAYKASDWRETLGVNTPDELRQIEDILKSRP